MASRTKASPSHTTPPASGTPALAAERIAQRAYEKWCERGCPHGADQHDWYAAEAELMAEQGRGAAAVPRR